MKKQYLFSATAFLLVLLLQACSKDNVSQFSSSSGSCSDTISFAEKIQPLVNQNCATSGCHDAATQSGGYDFTTHGMIAANANQMLSAMRWESGFVQMPQGMPHLPDSLIQQFSCWMDQGKQNN